MKQGIHEKWAIAAVTSSAAHEPIKALTPEKIVEHVRAKVIISSVHHPHLQAKRSGEQQILTLSPVKRLKTTTTTTFDGTQHHHHQPCIIATTTTTPHQVTTAGLKATLLAAAQQPRTMTVNIDIEKQNRETKKNYLPEYLLSDTSHRDNDQSATSTAAAAADNLSSHNSSIGFIVTATAAVHHYNSRYRFTSGSNDDNDDVGTSRRRVHVRRWLVGSRRMSGDHDWLASRQRHWSVNTIVVRSSCTAHQCASTDRCAQMNTIVNSPSPFIEHCMSVPLCTDLTRSSVYIGSALLLLLVFFYINHMNCYTFESLVITERGKSHRID